MGFAARIAWSSLRRRPGRALFAILGVAMGIAVVVSIFTVDHNTLLAAGRGQDDSWRADLEVRPKRALEDPLSELMAVKGVVDATPVFQSDARLFTAANSSAGTRADDGSGTAVRCIALELANASQMGLLRVEVGAPIGAEQAQPEGKQTPLGERSPEATLAPESSLPRVWIGRKIAEEQGLKPGDSLALSRPFRATKKNCVDGQMVDSPSGAPIPKRTRLEVAGILAYENIGRTSNGAVLVVPLAVGEAVFEQQFNTANYWVARDAEIDVERLQADLGREFAFDLRRGAVVGQQADERAFRNGVRLSGLMALSLGLFVIFHTLSMSLLERVREIGTLHALGAGRAQIGWAFFIEACVLCAGAGILGLGGGLYLAYQMLEHGITSLGMSKMVSGHFVVPWPPTLALCALGLGVALLGSVFPLLRARSQDTVEALRGQGLAAGGVARGFHLFAAFLLVAVLPIVFFSVVDLVGEESRELLGVVLLAVGVLALLVGIPLVVPSVVGALARVISAPLVRHLPFAGLFAAKSMSVGTARVAAAVAAITLVTSAFVGLRGMTRSLWLETDRWAAEAVQNKVYLSNLPWVELQPLAEQLRTYPGILALESGSQRLDAPFRILGAAPGELARFGPLADNPELLASFARGESILISERLAKQRGLEVGDQVPLLTSGSGVQNFEVGAISDAYGYFRDPHERAYGVLSSAVVERFFCLDGSRSDSLAVVLEPGADPSLALTALQAGLGLAEPPAVQTGEAVRAFELLDIDRDFFVFDVILILTGLLAALGVLNGQLLSAMERTKEIGVLRALGASPGQIGGSVLLESTAIGLAGGGLGLCLGLLTVPVVVAALRVVSGLDLPQPGFWPGSLWALPGALILALGAGLYPIWRMNRMDPAQAVRTA